MFNVGSSFSLNSGSKRKKRLKKKEGRTEFVQEKEFSSEMLGKPDNHEVNGEQKHVAADVPG